MPTPPFLVSNFAHLQEHDEQLVRLGLLAERYFPDDPNTTLLKRFCRKVRFLGQKSKTGYQKFNDL